MKRFYETADATRSSDGWTVALDGRTVKTPARKPLAVPARKLADAIAAEWAGQEEKIDPAAMPLTGLAGNFQIGIVNRSAFQPFADHAFMLPPTSIQSRHVFVQSDESNSAAAFARLECISGHGGSPLCL